MDIINICGFETGILAETIVGGTGGTCEISSTIKRAPGNYSFRAYPTGSDTGHCQVGRWYFNDGKKVAVDSTTVYARFYFYIALLPASEHEPIAWTGTLAGERFNINITSAGYLQAYNATTQLGVDGTTALTTGVWYCIEFKCLQNTDGWEIRINGNTELSGTDNLGSGTYYYVALGKAKNRHGQSVDFYYDDIVLTSDAWVGSGYVTLMKPGGDGTYSDWTIGAGAGDDWENVDEVPPDDDTTYLLSTGSPIDVETVGLEGCASAGIAGTITGVVTMAYVRRNVSGTGTVKVRTRSASTDLDTANNATITTTYTMLGHIHATDPATSAAWTLGGLDAAEIGVIETSTGGNMCWTSGYMMVAHSSLPGDEQQVILW